MPYDDNLKQDIGRDFAENSRPAFDSTQYLTKNAIQSLVVTNNQIRSEISRFNGDIDKAYNFYNNLYNSEKSKLSSYTGKIADCNYKIIQDKKLLEFTKDPLAKNRITDRINYNNGLVAKYSSKIDGLKKNCKNYRSILDGLDRLRKSSIKKKLLDSSKKALFKSAKVGKQVAKTTAKTTIEGVETGIGAGLDATTDSVAAGVSATGVGAPIGAGIKAGRLAGKTAYKTASTTTKGLVHAADKTAMSASKALKESIKLTKIQNLMTGYDDPKEMVKTVGQKGLNLVTTTVFTAFNFALKEIIKFIMSPVLYLLGLIILAYFIFIGVSIYSTVSGFSTVLESTLCDNSTKKKQTISTTSGNYEEKLIYSRLYDYFWDSENSTENTAAVIGLMCNIYEESGFKANNLQNSFESSLGMGDVEYTANVNSGEYSKDSFVNDSAGYGYCQYTYWSKKQSLYEYADNWFNNEDGFGYGQSFDIGNPEMQSYYLVYLLDEQYPSIASRLKELSTKYDQSTEEGWANAVYEATYIWVSEYECPDPSYTYLNGHPCSNYQQVATARALNAERIYSECLSTDYGDYDGSFFELEGTYFIQCESGPCVMCSVMNMLKRYCYMSGDSDWDSITPDLITDNGSNLHDSYVVDGSSVCGWGCFDSSGTPHIATDTGFSGPQSDQTIIIHGISCHIKYCSGQLSKDAIISLLNSHPEGIAVTCSYGSGGAHGKVITRYDSENDVFYTVDAGAWGSSSPGKNTGGYPKSLGSDAGGRYEMPLDSSQCWKTDGLLNQMLYYRYIEY